MALRAVQLLAASCSCNPAMPAGRHAAVCEYIDMYSTWFTDCDTYYGQHVR
jgi:hypothetical protein